METTEEHVAAARAVAEWTAQALLHALERTPVLPPSVTREHAWCASDAGATRATAVSLASAWIYDGLQQARQAAETMVAPKEHSPAVEQEDGGEPADAALALHAVQSLAAAVALDAVARAVEKVAPLLLQPPSDDAAAGEKESSVSSPTTLASAGDESPVDEPPPPPPPQPQATEDVPPAKVDGDAAAPAAADDEAAPLTERTAARVLVASRYVSALFDEAVHHAPAAAELEPPPPSVAAPTVAAEENAPALDTGLSSEPTAEPPRVLRAVRAPPAKQATRRAKPTPTPALAPLPPPPKTAGPTAQRRPAPRESPRTMANGDGDKSAPAPRLRKLEEYMELHPIDRVKKIYYPRRLPQQQQQQQQQQRRKQPTSGYDAELEGGEGDEEEGDDSDSGGDPAETPHALSVVRQPTSVKLAPLPSQARAAAAAMTVADRPDRLGLLAKPKKRSGFCQQCVFDGRPCKVSDCLKHQRLVLH